MESNECSQCHVRENAFICFCQEVLLCESCLTFHLLTNPSAAHKPVPLSSYQLIKEIQCEPKSEPESGKSLQLTMQEKLESELARLQDFRTSALEQLRQVRQQWLLQINEAANEIESILKVKCDTMAQDLKQSLEELQAKGVSTTFPTFSKGPAPDAEILNLSFDVGKLDLNPLFKQFFSVSLKYTEEKHQDNFLYKLFGGQPTLAVFDPVTESVLSFSTMSERLLHNSCWVMSKDGLLITGGSISGSCRNDVLKYLPTEEKMEKMASMLGTRRSHASLVYGRRLFVFGGIREEESLSDCEALDLDGNTWSAVSSLRNPRGQLGAVEYQGSAYLAGGCNVAEIEVYDFMRDNFEAIVLPGPWLLEGCSLLALDDSLLILHGNYKGEMYLFQPDTCSLQKLCELCHGNSWSNCVPVVQGKTLYMLRADSIFKVDLETHKSSYVLKITKTAKKRKTLADQDSEI